MNWARFVRVLWKSCIAGGLLCVGTGGLPYSGISPGRPSADVEVKLHASSAVLRIEHVPSRFAVPSNALQLGLDYLPLLFAANGRGLADSGHVTRRCVRFAGRLGATEMIQPTVSPTGCVLLFLPPLRPDGLPDYQLDRYVPLLAKFRSSPAVLIASLDLLPPAYRSWQTRGRTVPSADSWFFNTPSIVAVSHAVATLLLMAPVDSLSVGYDGDVKITLEYRATRRSVR
jgi:hypothetical protein